jgi:2-methylcitrate dehydratase PrpD
MIATTPSATPSASATLIAIVADDGAATDTRAMDYWRRLPDAAARRVAFGDRFVQSLLMVVRADAIAGPCSIAGLQGRFAARDAGFANGALMAAEAPLPVAAIVAAVMALTEERGGDDGVAIAAVGFGLGVLDRLERAAGAGVCARGHLAEGILGAPAATAAAGRAIGLDDAAMADALGVAGSMASGSREWQGGDADLLAGWMARSAILAARLAQAGFSGPAEVFEGRKGLFNAYAGPGRYTVAPLTHEPS